MKSCALKALMVLCCIFGDIVDYAAAAGAQDEEIIKFNISGFYLDLSKAFITQPLPTSSW
jgi:hypothetical protein